jgi:hypothetical protein
MAERKNTRGAGRPIPGGLTIQPPLNGEVLEVLPNGTKFSTLTECRQEMARCYWALERGKMDLMHAGARIKMMDMVCKTIVAERALRVAERASEHAPLVGVQIVAPESKLITSEDEK